MERPFLSSPTRLDPARVVDLSGGALARLDELGHRDGPASGGLVSGGTGTTRPAMRDIRFCRSRRREMRGELGMLLELLRGVVGRLENVNGVYASGEEERAVSPRSGRVCERSMGGARPSCVWRRPRVGTARGLEDGYPGTDKLSRSGVD